MIVIYTSINRSASGLILAIHEGSKIFFLELSVTSVLVIPRVTLW